MNSLDTIFKDAHLRSYPKGQILLYQGEKTPDFFRIIDGYVKVYDITAAGNEKLLLILGPNDRFPLVWTFRGVDALHYFYETFDEAEVAVVERKKIVNSIKESHEFTAHLLEYFVGRTADLMKRIDCIEATSAKHKVAQVLGYLAAAHGEKVARGAYRVQLHTTHQSIADMAGVTRETASVQLKELEGEKMFSSSSNELIVHIDRIERFLSGE